MAVQEKQQQQHAGLWKSYKVRCEGVAHHRMSARGVRRGRPRALAKPIPRLLPSSSLRRQDSRSVIDAWQGLPTGVAVSFRMPQEAAVPGGNLLAVGKVDVVFLLLSIHVTTPAEELPPEQRGLPEQHSAPLAQRRTAASAKSLQ